jgi:hypothetical protein
MGRKIFRFEAWWQKKHGFAKEVNQVWQVKTRHLDTWGVLKTKPDLHLDTVNRAIPTYSMSVFLLPPGLCSEINSMMQKF